MMGAMGTLGPGSNPVVEGLQGLGCRILVLGFRIQGLGCRVKGLGRRV